MTSILSTWFIVQCVLQIVITSQTLPGVTGGIFPGNDDNACGINGVCACQLQNGPLEVDCTGLQLTSLPIGVPSNISILSVVYTEYGLNQTRILKNNQLQTVPMTWMLQFQNLATLDVTENFISGAFKLPPRLFYLYAGNNEIDNFEEFFREGCSQLRVIHLDRNKVTIIPDGSLKSCFNLNELKIKGNNLIRFNNRTFEGLTSLRTLQLSVNLTEPIPPGVFTDVCKSLVSLTLVDSTSFYPLPVGLFKACYKLHEVYVLQNNFSEIQAGTFQGCTAVSILTVGRIPVISNVPERLLDGIQCLSSLTFANLNLSEIPNNFFRKVGCLVQINFSYNKINQLPVDLFSPKMHSTTHIFLSYNELSYISPKFFSNLPKLKEIHLSNNCLQQLPSRIFWGTQLQVLYLFQNNITAIEGRPFVTGNESTVREVEIRGNPLQKVTSEAVSDLVPNANMQCEASNIPIILRDVGPYLKSSVERGGFGCSENKVCQSCGTGYYGNRETLGCISCPEGGFYQDRVASVSEDVGGIGCKICNNGTFVKNGAGVSPLSCEVCPEGTDKNRPAGFRACFCLDNYYRNDRFGKCFPCPNAGMNCSGEYVSIKRDYFWHWKISKSLFLYKQFVANMQRTDDSYDRNSSVFLGLIPMAHKCPVANRCINDDTKIEGNCNEGYQGWMCTVCEEGYFGLLGSCRKCHSEMAFGMFILFLILVIFFWFVIIQPLVTTHSRSDESYSSGDLIISRVKIAFGFYQVVDSYWQSVGTYLWFAVIHVAISKVVEVMSFTLSSILVSPSCYISWFKWNPYTKLWAFYATLLTLTLSLIVLYCVIWFLSKLRMIQASHVNLRKTCLKLFTFTMFVSYTETCDVVFQLYNCDEFSLYEYNKKEKVHLLHSHYNVSCDTDLYKRYRRVFALPGWILICVFPLIMWALLYKYSRPTRPTQGHTVSTKKEYPEWLRFMSQNYKSECWYWEIIELGRKVLLTFLPLAFGWEGIFVKIGLFASGLFLALHAFVRPMRNRWDNILQFLSLLFLNFNMIVAAIHDSNDTEPVTYLTVSLMNVTIFIILTVEALWKLFSLIKKCCLSTSTCGKTSLQDESTPLLINDVNVPPEDTQGLGVPH